MFSNMCRFFFSDGIVSARFKCVARDITKYTPAAGTGERNTENVAEERVDERTVGQVDVRSSRSTRDFFQEPACKSFEGVTRDVAKCNDMTEKYHAFLYLTGTWYVGDIHSISGARRLSVTA